VAKSLHRKEQEEELIRCVQDPKYFMRKYIRIVHPERGRIVFDLFPYQEQVIDNLIDNRFNIVLKSRQLGLSTVVSAYCLWLSVFHRDKNILLIADKFFNSKALLAKIRVAWEELPRWMLERLELTELEAESVQNLKFSNGSVIQALPTTPHTGRGQAASFVVVDEAAANEKLEEGWKSIYSTVQAGGRIVVFSTPWGRNNQFYKLWSNSVNGKNDFVRLELPWHVHPEHDQTWFDRETRNMDERQISSELLCSFESSGNTFFNQATIQWLQESSVAPIAYNGPTTRTLQDTWVWKGPVAGHKYVISADVSRGDAEDFSAFHVIDAEEFEIVAEYLGKIAPDKFGDYLVKVGTQYNTAQIVQEKNTIGIATAIKLRDLGYPNLFWDNQKPEDLIYMSEEEAETVLPGWTTKTGNQPGNREEILAYLENALRNHQLRVYSTRFAEQTTYFAWNGKRGQSAKGKSDDLITSLAIGCYIVKPNGAFGLTNSAAASDWHKAFLASFSRSQNTMATGVGTYGQPANAQAIPQDLVAQQKFQLTPNKQNEYYNGVQLKPGVRRENVAKQQIFNDLFGWLFR
jgi:hypothetical protein